jgi:hypothetical protein
MLLGFGLGTAALAADEDEQNDELRRNLVAATTPGQYQGELIEILKLSPARVGSILGPLFTEEAYLPRVELVGYVAAYLADNPVTGQNGRKVVLLDQYILRRARGDEAFVKTMRDTLRVLPQIKRQPGWDLLFDHARDALASTTAPRGDREAAIDFLGREAGGREEDALAALVVEVRRILGLLASADPATRVAGAEEAKALEPTILGALDGLLVYRFRNLKEASEYLEGAQKTPYGDKLKELSRRKDRATQDRDLAIAYGRELIALAQGPKALLDRLNPAVTPYPQLRLEAIKRAARLKPEANDDWVALFRLVFLEGTDEQVGREAIKILDGADFGRNPKAADPVAAAVAERLARRNGDGVEYRRDLARVLGDLGNRAHLARALGQAADAGTEVELDVFTELIRSAGKVERAKAEDVLLFYPRDLSDPARVTAIREAVVEALGRSGVRTSDGAAAAKALREILRGDGEFPRAQSASVRRLAIDKLEAYPGPETSDLLGELAEGPDEEEAASAIQVLSQILLRYPEDRHAPRALAALAHQALAESRRVLALRQLGGLPPAAPADVRAEVLEVLHGILTPEAPPALRLAAARTAAALGDGSALDAILAAWKSEPASEDWMRVLQDAVSNTVGRGPADDEAVARTLALIAREPQGLGLALDVARSVTALAPSRPVLQAALAALLAERARANPADPQSASDLKEADDILERAVPALPAGKDQEAARGLWVRVLGALAAAAGDTEEAKAKLLDAVRAAAASQDRAVAQQGLDLSRRLETEPLRKLLTAAEQAELDVALGRIRAALQR